MSDSDDKYWKVYEDSIKTSLPDTCEDVLESQKTITRLFGINNPNSRVYQKLNVLGSSMSYTEIETFFEVYEKLSTKYEKITEDIQLSLFEEILIVMQKLEEKAHQEASNYTEELSFNKGIESKLEDSPFDPDMDKYLISGVYVHQPSNKTH